MIEKVGYTQAAGSPRPVRRSGAVGSADFAAALSKAEGASAASGVEAASSIASVGGLGSLLGAQEVDEREARKRKAVRHGRLTLDALAQLRDALLLGSLPLSTLQNLEKLVAAERGADMDPLLSSILDDIEVRAAVEIAKLEMAGILPPNSI